MEDSELFTPEFPWPPPTRLVTLVTIKNLLADRAMTVKRPRAQNPSLIFRLPAEMLAEVFMQVTADDDQATASLRAPMHAHFILSHVCGLWRAVALHTPALWCRVVLHLDKRRTGFLGLTQLTRACFARSCELPLALTITSSVTNSSSIPNLCMDLVLPVRHRIRHLELRLPAVFTESLFKLPRNSLKALESITVYASTGIATFADLDFPIGGTSSAWFRSMSALDGAPLLSTVKLGYLNPLLNLPTSRVRQTDALRLDPYIARLPWAQLTQLELDFLELRADDALHALGLCEKLVRCKIEVRVMPPLQPVLAFTAAAGLIPVTTEAPAPDRKPPPVNVPALRVFALVLVGHVHDAAPARFFDRLVLPALVDLAVTYRHVFSLRGGHGQGHVGGGVGGGALPSTTLLELQRRSGFESLERLSVVNRTGDSLIPVLESNPRLVRLELVLCGERLAPLACALTVKLTGAGEIPLLPRLRALVLMDHWAEEAPAGAGAWNAASKAALEMARSRAPRASPSPPPHAQDGHLESLHFGSETALPPKKAAAFERLRMREEGRGGSGMRVRVVDGVSVVRAMGMSWGGGGGGG